jgi:hypothetical protein
MQARVYIVRIYRRDGDNVPAGTIEIVRSGARKRFRGFGELRAILGLQLPCRKRAQPSRPAHPTQTTEKEHEH